MNRYLLIAQSTFISNYTISHVNFAADCLVWQAETPSVCDVIVAVEKSRRLPPDFVASLF